MTTILHYAREQAVLRELNAMVDSLNPTATPHVPIRDLIGSICMALPPSVRGHIPQEAILRFRRGCRLADHSIYDKSIEELWQDIAEELADAMVYYCFLLQAHAMGGKEGAE